MKGAAWTIDEEIELLIAFRDFVELEDMTIRFGRTPAAITSRLMRLGKLIDQPNYHRYIREKHGQWVPFATYAVLKQL